MLLCIFLFLYNQHIQTYSFNAYLEGDYAGEGIVVSEVLENKGVYQFKFKDQKLLTDKEGNTIMRDLKLM